MFPDPDIFNPDRFLGNGMLNPDILDLKDVAFGFGRRMCPGIQMAYDTLWITIATMLAVPVLCSFPLGDTCHAVHRGDVEFVIEPASLYYGKCFHN